MKKLLDLRFVIGVFFVSVGLLLVIYYFSQNRPGTQVNLWSGIVFFIFGSGMILLSYLSTLPDEPATASEG